MSNSQDNRQNIYVELDVLLDTRLGTIARLSKDAAVKTLQSDYHTRVVDSFDHVDMAEYKALYAQRDGDTLSMSMLSGAVPFLRDVTAALAEQASSRPYHNGGKLIVNTHPYTSTLSPKELDDIGRAIAARMDGHAPVELVDISPESLTPYHCKHHFAMMMVYDFGAWMEMHSSAFRTTRLPEVTLYSPRIYHEIPREEELQSVTKEIMHPVQAMEQLAAPIIALKLIDIKNFSVITPT
ncbi:hypothetical protein D3C71_78300 [compost metagenome]